MSDSSEEAAKIKTWLEKTTLYYASSPRPDRLTNELKAAQIEPDSAVPVVINLLATETNSYFLPKVVWLAGVLKAEAAVPQLVEMLKNVENSQVREAVVKALTLLNSDETVLLAANLLDNERAAVRDWAVILLQQLKAKKSVPYLLERLEREPDPLVLWRTQVTLAEQGAREVIPAFIQLLKSQDVSKISAALKILRQLQAKEAVPQIIEFIRDSKTYSKEVGVAIHVLGALGSRAEVPEFMSWLKAEDSQLRFFGVAILQTLKVKEAAPAMLDLIKDVKPEVRMKAIMTLGEWQTREAIPQIIEALEDTDRTVKIQAVIALHIMKAREAVPNLLKILNQLPVLNNSYQFDYLSQRVVLALESLGDEAVQELIKSDIARVRATLEIEREREQSRLRGDHF